MESLSNATISAVSFMLSVYVSLWTALCFVAINTYEAVRYISKVYPPAERLMVAIEKTVTAVWAPSSDASLTERLHLVIEEVWTPESVLELLGLLSVGIPASVVMLGSTGCVLLVTLVTTVVFFACAVLALPVAVWCTFAYCIGNGASKLFGMAMGVYPSLMSWIRSSMGGVFGARKSETDPVGNMVLGFKRSIPKNHLQGAGDKDTASGSNNSTEGSPKISASVGEEEKSTSHALGTF